jgi:3'-phosphoadenosine 5'-phosphosulfate sulfotransferase (PAPS reductase)/FAD synthetase
VSTRKLSTTLECLDEAHRKYSSCCIAYSGGKDSVAVLDMASRVWPKSRMHVVMAQTLIGGDVFQPAIDYVKAKWGLDVVCFQHPLVADWLRAQSYCDISPLTADLPHVSLEEALTAKMYKLGAQCVLFGCKDSDSIHRRRQLHKSQAQRPWMVYPLRSWQSIDVYGYLASRGLKGLLSTKRRATEVDLVSSSILNLHDNYPKDYHSMRELFPYIEAVVRRRGYYGAQE